MTTNVRQAGDLSMALGAAFLHPGSPSNTWHPEAIGDPSVTQKLSLLETALRAGLAEVNGIADAFDRADRARAFAQHAVTLAKVMWKAALETSAADSHRPALLDRASTINDLARDFAAAAGSEIPPSIGEELAQVRSTSDNNRDNIASLRSGRI